jgi:hypothetical protein
MPKMAVKRHLITCDFTKILFITLLRAMRAVSISAITQLKTTGSPCAPTSHIGFDVGHIKPIAAFITSAIVKASRISHPCAKAQ